MPRLLPLFLVLLTGCAGTAPFDPASGRWVDLSHAYGDDTLFWPTSDPFELETVAEGDADGYYYSAYRFTTSEHGGTHLDAPVHFARGRNTNEAIPLEQLTGPASVIDVSAACAEDPDYAIRAEDIEAFEADHGRLEAGAIVLFRTGFSRRWPDAQAYLGTTLRGEAGAAALHFPGLSAAAATLLAEDRRIGAVGLDTASLDPGTSTDFIAHRILMARDIVGFENLTGLEQLPPRGAYLVALPMKITGGSGGPLRAAAFVPR